MKINSSLTPFGALSTLDSPCWVTGEFAQNEGAPGRAIARNASNRSKQFAANLGSSSLSIVLCALIVPLLVQSSAIAREASPVGRYRFDLEKGAELDVCRAYSKRLNETHFAFPPYCDRPEDNAVEGFAKLSRAYLTEDEILRLDRQVSGFLTRKDIHMWDRREAERKRLGREDHDLAQRRADLKRSLQYGASIQRPFRFDPPVDIDNDGIPDQIVMWRKAGSVCGAFYSNDPMPRRTATIALILDRQGNVDPLRTQRIFGHPAGGYEISWKDKTGKVFTSQSPKFRPIGFYVGIFVFESKAYFDTFYDSWGDLQNRRRSDPNLPNTLGVFKSEKGKTKEMCEILWKKPKGR